MWTTCSGAQIIPTESRPSPGAARFSRLFWRTVPRRKRPRSPVATPRGYTASDSRPGRTFFNYNRHSLGSACCCFSGGARISLTGIPQIKPTFLEIAPSGIPSNIIPHSKGVKCGLIRSNSPFSYSNHRPAKPKIPKPLVYAQVSPLGTSFATP